MQRIAILLAFICAIHPASSQEKAWKDDATPLHRAQKALTDVIVHDIFSPPVASRIYAYANIAAYETLVKANPGYRSLYGQLKDFPDIPAAKKKISYPVAAVYAFLLTGQKFIFSDSLMQDSINNIMAWYNKKTSRNEYESSLEYGKLVFKLVSSWAALDGYSQSRKLSRYRIIKEEGKWIPTPPGYMAAVEPYWNKIRTMALDSAAQFKPPRPPAFSQDKGSDLYQLAYDVYHTTNSMSEPQKATAQFWDCNPFFLNVEGHLNYAVKKMSPGGHWMSIAGIACRKTGSNIMRTAFVYTFTSIALFDGFIACWDEKYRSNLIRPETYINKYIDETWRPLLQTPPFPEYNSGHSVISLAAATVLTHIFGDHFAFDDSSENEFGLLPRHFNSFLDAASEAAISRLYGGIHYRPAIENGKVQGKLIALTAIRKITWNN